MWIQKPTNTISEVKYHIKQKSKVYSRLFWCLYCVVFAWHLINIFIYNIEQNNSQTWTTFQIACTSGQLGINDICPCWCILFLYHVPIQVVKAYREIYILYKAHIMHLCPRRRMEARLYIALGRSKVFCNITKVRLVNPLKEAQGFMFWEYCYLQVARVFKIA